MGDAGAHLSDFALARIHAGELEPDGPQQEHLAACAACRARLESIPAKTAELQRALPLSRLLAARAARPAAPRRSWLMSPRLLVGLAAASACLLLAAVAVLRHAGQAGPRRGEGGIRLKGACQIEWIVARDRAQQRAEPGFVFEVGDRIGLRVRAPREAVAQVFSIDERGRVEVLIPAPGGAAPRVAAGVPSVLPSSLELEAPLEPRRIAVVLALRAYRPAELERAARLAPRGPAGPLRRLALPGLLHLDSRRIPGGNR